MQEQEKSVNAPLYELLGAGSKEHLSKLQPEAPELKTKEDSSLSSTVAVTAIQSETFDSEEKEASETTSTTAGESRPEKAEPTEQNVPQDTVEEEGQAASAEIESGEQIDAPKPETEEEESSRPNSPELDVEKALSITDAVAKSRSRTDSSESEADEHQPATDSTKTVKFKQTRKKKDKGKTLLSGSSAFGDLEMEDSAPTATSPVRRRGRKISPSESDEPSDSSSEEEDPATRSIETVSSDRPEATGPRQSISTRAGRSYTRLGRVLSMVPNATRITSFGGVGVFAAGAVWAAPASPETALGLGGASLFSAIVNVLTTEWRSYRQIITQDHYNQDLVDKLNQLEGPRVIRTVSVSKAWGGLKFSVPVILNLLATLLILVFTGIAISETDDDDDDDDTSPLGWSAATVGAVGILLFTAIHTLGDEIILSRTLNKLYKERAELVDDLLERGRELQRTLLEQRLIDRSASSRGMARGRTSTTALISALEPQADCSTLEASTSQSEEEEPSESLSASQADTNALLIEGLADSPQASPHDGDDDQGDDTSPGL